MNLTQARKEIADPTPVNERGWQDALEAVYALKINELRVKNGDLTYVDQGPFKPLRVRSLEDRDKTAFRKMYERIVGGVAKILENRPRDEVATKTEVSGRLDNPRVGVMEAVVKLVENAFFRAILPGFDREARRSGRHAAAAKGD